ncbi:MAG: hypothetical protein ACRDIY_06920, partial [Chloroflexota bacterium]
AALVGREIDVHRRTVYRTLALLHSPSGCRARGETVGAVWVCWGCGRALAPALDDPAIASLRASHLLPLDLGGYCARCQRALDQAPGDGGELPPGLRRGRSASGVATRRASVIPVGALYQNPGLMRELMGSDRRLLGRDFVVANLAENPRAGPTAVHRRLADELAIVPTSRSVARVSGALHGPKARIVFSSLGALGWSCLACDAWGTVADPEALRRGAPDGFVPTDVRGLCPACQDAENHGARASS